MDFEITIDGRTEKVSLQPSEIANTYQGRLGDTGKQSSNLVAIKTESNSMLVSINDKMYLLRIISRTLSSIEFEINGERSVAFLGKAPTKEKAIYSQVASVTELVKANFPAKVVKINAIAGSVLKESDTIMIVEAMKMEAQIKTPKDCTVKEIFVKEGDMVERGRKLARLSFN